MGDLVQDFDDLLAGKEITGKGCSAAGGDDDEDAFKSNCEAADVDDAVKLFNDLSTEHLQKDEVKEALAGCPRAFCVLVVANQFNVKEKKLEASLTNYQVLVGPQDKVDKGKEIISLSQTRSGRSASKSEPCDEKTTTESKLFRALKL